MKLFLLIISFLITPLSATTAFAQKTDNGTKQRAVHMTQILNLDDATITHFITTYERYRQELCAAHEKYHRIKPRKQENGTLTRLTDEQVKKNIENSFALSQSILDIRRKYYAEYLTFLTPRQIERLYELEKKDGERIRELAKKNKKKK